MSKHIPSISTLLHFPQLRLSNVNIVGAVVFTMGCCVLVVNAILSFLPYAGYGFHLPSKIVYVEGWLSIASNLFFLTGSGFAFVQILNAKRAELYDERSQMAISEEDMGLKAEKSALSVPYLDIAVTSPEDFTKDCTDSACSINNGAIDEKSASKEDSTWPSSNESTTCWIDPLRDPTNWLSAETLAPVMGIYAMTPTSSTDDLVSVTTVTNPESKDLESQTISIAAPNNSSNEELWRYIPSSHEMWVRSIHEIGFLATTIFFLSSLTYFSASIASIITIIQKDEISRWIRYPQLVAAVGFAVASIILMIQAQEKWYLPAWRRVRWYVNLLNLVGSCGFIVCACFGLVDDVYWARYQFGMSYLWGSWAFLFGSVMQWYKILHKHAVARRKEWVDDGFDREKYLMF